MALRITYRTGELEIFSHDAPIAGPRLTADEAMRVGHAMVTQLGALMRHDVAGTKPQVALAVAEDAHEPGRYLLLAATVERPGAALRPLNLSAKCEGIQLTAADVARLADVIGMSGGAWTFERVPTESVDLTYTTRSGVWATEREGESDV